MNLGRYCVMLASAVFCLSCASCGPMAKSGLDADGKVHLSGNFEVDTVELSFKMPGRVETRAVDEGTTVSAGQEIARLDMAELNKEYALRQADVEFGKAAVSEVEAGARPQEITQSEALVQAAQWRVDAMVSGARKQEIQAVANELRAAESDVALLEKEKNRVNRLFEKGAVPAQQNDRASTAHQSALERVAALREKYSLIKEGPRAEDIEQAKAALRQAQERHSLILAGAREETKAQVKARLAQAQAALELTQVRLDNAVLKSPIAGLVLSKNLEVGEFAAPGTPVVTVANLQNIYLRAYIDEADLGRVKVGQTVEIHTDTYPGKVYTGTVSFLSSEAEFTPKSVQTPKERVKLVYRVKVVAQNPDSELKPGMPADAAINVR